MSQIYATMNHVTQPQIDLWFPCSAEPSNVFSLGSGLLRLGPLEFFRTQVIAAIRDWQSRGYRVRSVLLHCPYGITFQGSTDPGVFVVDSWRRMMQDGPAVFHKTKIQILNEYQTAFRELQAIVPVVRLYLGSVSFLANRSSAELQASLAKDITSKWNTNVWGPAYGIFNEVCIDSGTIDSKVHAGWIVKDWLRTQGYKVGIEHLPHKSYSQWADANGADFSVSYHGAMLNGVNDKWGIFSPSTNCVNYQLLNDVEEAQDPAFNGKNIVPLVPGWITTKKPHPSWNLSVASSISSTDIKPV
jgi:hypothetical protein